MAKHGIQNVSGQDGAEFKADKFSNIGPQKSVRFGTQKPEAGTSSGGSGSNSARGPKTTYSDPVSKKTVKRAS